MFVYVYVYVCIHIEKERERERERRKWGKEVDEADGATVNEGRHKAQMEGWCEFELRGKPRRNILPSSPLMYIRALLVLGYPGANYNDD